MGTIVEKTVVVGQKEWREAARQAVTEAVSWLFDGNTKITSNSNRLKSAAELLSAADKFNGRANMQENGFIDSDIAVVEEWDLSDEMDGEDDEPIWPELSAKLREIAGPDPRLLPMAILRSKRECRPSLALNSRLRWKNRPQKDEMMGDIHVLPVGGWRDHEESAECWCRPRRHDDEPSVVIHNSLDQRELHETGERKVQ